MKGTFFIICAFLGLLLSFLPAKDSVAQNAIKYKWEQVYYSTLNNQKSLLFSHEMLDSKLAFADIDGDGDLDIFVGQENGELAFFENQGTATTPLFELITQQYKAIFEVKRGGQKVKIRKKRACKYFRVPDSVLPNPVFNEWEKMKVIASI